MNSKGAAYEERAARFLQRAGYEILDRNWSCPMGELDIVARKDGAVVFVEVRARSSADYGLPSETVSRSKRVKIIKAALAYLKARAPVAESYRFDFIGLMPGAEPEHIEDAFGADGFGF